MANRKYRDCEYLDPAYSLIKGFATSGKLTEGIDAVAAIVRRDRSTVYRWMQPLERGGTGGFIPVEPQRMLSQYAKSSRAPRGLKELFGARAA